LKDIVLMTVKKILGLFLIMGICGWVKCGSYGQDKHIDPLSVCDQFKQLHVNIREANISADSAKTGFQDIIKSVRQFYPADSGRDLDTARFVFPVRNYRPRESIGGKGRGYRDKTFDLFNTYARGSHPAQDIFVKDRNQDGIDDVYCMPIDILAFTSGVVLATEVDWQPGSEHRGGNWVWIYDPALDMLIYYAHNSKIAVVPGQWVNAGDKIAEMGRTGFNAFQSRSPTHLHLMVLGLSEIGLPIPVNTYGWLLNSEVRYHDWLAHE
jgi:hypothetical protein